MAQIAQIMGQTEIKCPREVIYDFMKNNFSKLPNTFPQVFKSVQFVEGEEGRPGNVMLVKYELGGRNMSVKIRTEIIEEEKSIAYNVLEGDVMQIYKSMGAKFTFNEKGYAEIFIDYEKADESYPNPDDYMNLALNVFKGLGVYLNKN